MFINLFFSSSMEYYLSRTLCVWFFMILFTHKDCLGCLEKERIALLELNVTDWDGLLTWDDQRRNDCCAWEGVQCNNTTRQVIQLSLQNAFGDMQYLNASLFLPFEELQHLDLADNILTDLEGLDRLSKLKKLHFLNLQGNNLNNNIVPSLGALTFLNTLDVGGNMFNGSLSQGLCELKNLGYLNLSWNHFEGILPPCLSNLTSLRLLDFKGNRLSGKIPWSLISNLNSLEYISLSNNQFDGGLSFNSPLSTQLKFLDLSNCNLNMSTTDLLRFLHNQNNLEYVRLSHNNLHGRFPNWLVENNTRLATLLLRNNSLTGHIQLDVVVSLLSQFDVSDNHIQGKLQTDIGVVLSQLTYLNLSKNSIEGTLPTPLGHINGMSHVILDFSSNMFSGEIPESWALNLKKLYILILSNNMLQGRISPSLFNLNCLNILRLNNNQFTGSIPKHTVGSFGLKIFDISQNHMSGRIPSWIPNLYALFLRNNSFYGPIPLEFCKLSKVEFLILSHNHLSGSIPSCLNLTSLKYMHFQENKFSGPIPKAILQSSNLITLNLKHNNLSGNVMIWFGLLRNLRVLLLKGNHLSGSIPHQLCQLKKISILDLSNNTFSGSIPPCFSNFSFGNIGSAAFPVFDVYPTGLFEYTDLSKEKWIQVFDKPTYTEQEEVEFMTKTRSCSYKGDIIYFISGIDLSGNQLTGLIPNEIGELTVAKALNLSHNQLTGSIPRTLSNLRQLQSLDLSHNELTGEIPSELTDMYTLKFLNVSYNNLSGEIPYMKAPFITSDESSCRGNSFLCGPPLQKPCKTTIDSTTIVAVAKLSASYGMDLVSLFASFATSYILTLAGLVIVLYINPDWRHMWFNLIDACLSFMFPFWSKVIYKISNR